MRGLRHKKVKFGSSPCNCYKQYAQNTFGSRWQVLYMSNVGKKTMTYLLLFFAVKLPPTNSFVMMPQLTIILSFGWVLQQWTNSNCSVEILYLLKVKKEETPFSLRLLTTNVKTLRSRWTKVTTRFLISCSFQSSNSLGRCCLCPPLPRYQIW